MNEVLLETVIEKVDTHERKITGHETEIREMKERVARQPDHKESFDDVNNRLSELLDHIKKKNSEK